MAAVAWTAIGLLTLTTIVAVWANFYLRAKLDAYEREVKDALEHRSREVFAALERRSREVFAGLHAVVNGQSRSSL